MELNLKGKVAVVTGGSTGIGLAVAHGLAAEGVHVALCARTREKVERAAAEIKKAHGVRTLGIVADVTKAADILAFAAAVEKEFGGCDILINNAGEGTHETIMDAPDERWQYYLDMLLMSAVRMSRALVPSMKKRGGGAIVNNASICAALASYSEPIYSVAKAGMVMFSKCLAHELIPHKIRVNCVNPGLVRTPGWQVHAERRCQQDGITADQFFAKVAHELAPINRFATPEEMADFFVFLCSDRASYCVGATYYVDGGWLSVTT
jgi:NAD(P)-dependent dehydrogenase (short-subunit alcohol dehydrogenase family)